VKPGHYLKRPSYVSSYEKKILIKDPILFLPDAYKRTPHQYRIGLEGIYESIPDEYKNIKRRCAKSNEPGVILPLPS
jgi:hypothetical protein